MAGATGVLGSLRILVDADTAKAQRALKSLGGKAQLAGAAIGAGLGLAGVAALRIGDDYKAATDAIRISSGDTGDVLKGLESEFQAVSKRVPDSLAVVGQALGDVRSRTGLVGDDLGKLTESFLDVSRLLDVDVSTAIDKVTRLYGDWSVAQADQLKTNDLLLRASQASGMSYDALAEQLVQFGAPLRNIGMDLEDSVAMLAKWEKEGVNTVLALGGMKIALGEFAKEGIGAKEGLEDLIKNIQETDDVARAMALGVSRFGSRAGPDMVAAIREGRFEFADFKDTLVEGAETIPGLSDETRDFGDAIKEMTNRVKLAVGPFTSAFAGIAESMGNAIFLLPALGAGLGKGVVKMWQKVAATGAGKAAAGAAGALAGAAYSAAAAVVGKLRAAVLALWAMMGGARILAAAGAAGAKGGAAYSAAAALAMRAGAVAKGAFAAAGMLAGSAFAAAAVIVAAPILAAIAIKMGIDLAHNIGTWQQEVQKGVDQAVAQPAEEALDNLKKLTTHMQEVQGLGRVLGDTFGGQQQVEGLRNLARAIRDDTDMTADEIERAGVLLAAAAHEAGARGNEAVQQEILDIASMIAKFRQPVEAAYDVLSSATITPPSIAAPIREEFKLATAAVAAGFGSIKQALANPPQMISKKDRLGNMAKRMKKVMVNIRKATEKDDPMAQRYWEKARVKQQLQIDKLKGKTTSSLGDVKSAYRKAGVSVKGTWTEVKSKTVTAATQAADGAITQAERIPAAIDAMDLTSSGVKLMDELAAGIRSGIANAVAAANEAAAAVAAPIKSESPPKTGPLKHIDKWGGALMDTWLKPIEAKVGKAGSVGARLAAAVAPTPALGALGLAGGAGGHMGLGGGTGAVIQVGTLIADEAGLDELERRMSRRGRRRKRGT